MFGSIFSGVLSPSFQTIILFSVMLVVCSSFPSNTSYELSRESQSTSNDSQVSTIRQSGGTFAVSAPVAASLAFVGLNLAFISLLVPFVMTAITIGERRNDRENEGKDTLANQWERRHLSRRWKFDDGYNLMGRGFQVPIETSPRHQLEQTKQNGKKT